MPLSNPALKSMGDHLASIATHLAIHTADPGTTGAAKSTAGMVAAGWAGTADADGGLTITGKACTGGASKGPVGGVGLWNAAGTIFYGGFEIPAGGTNDKTFNAAGAYTLN